MTTKSKPKIDRTAPDADVVVEKLDPAAPAPAPAPEAEPAMPTAENAPPCLFKPGNGITTTDVMEITLMYLLQLSGSDVQVAPGALRLQPMDATRVSQLSPEAARWLKPVAEVAPQA